jgi:hypothetical protein
VAKGHSQKCAYQRTLAVKQLCSQCGPSPHHVETSNRFRIFITDKLIASEDSGTVPCCVLKKKKKQ